MRRDAEVATATRRRSGIIAGMTTSTVLVTGATSGIGLYIVRLFAEHGLTAIVGARDAARGEEVATEVGGRPLPLDVADANTMAAAAATSNFTS